jgi:hypothetical protein
MILALISSTKNKRNKVKEIQEIAETNKNQ